MKLALLFLLFPALTAYAIHIVSTRANLDIDTKKVTFMTGDVSEKMFTSVIFQTAATEPIPGDRVVVINSLGGYASFGAAIIELMEAEKITGVRQICIVNGMAQSMAFNIFTHCNVRLAVPTAVLMAHALALGGLDCKSHRCTPTYLRLQADALEGTDLQYRRDNAAALSLTPSEYDGFASKDHEWPLDELLKRKFLHAIISLK